MEKDAGVDAVDTCNRDTDDGRGAAEGCAGPPPEVILYSDLRFKTR